MKHNYNAYTFTSGHMLRVLAVLVFAGWMGACVPVEEEKALPLNIRPDNPDIRHIVSLQQHQRRDSLISALASEDPGVRYAAARAFASFQDTSALSALLPLLADPHGEVRAMAAFAIGQLGLPAAETPLTAAFEGKDSARLHQVANSAILEAVGKLGSARYLFALGTIDDYLPTDTLLLLGQVRGIYRYALRQLTGPEGTATMVHYLADPVYPLPVRVIAANYLHRAQELDLKPHASRLLALWHAESHPYLRMCLATALGKLNTDEARDILLTSIQTESDDRVKCNILRALQGYAYESVAPTFLSAAKSDQPALAELGGEFFLRHGREREAGTYRTAMAESATWHGATRLAEAANKQMTSMFASPKLALSKDIQARLQQARDPYEKAAWLKAWAGEPRNFESLQTYMQSGQPNPVRLQAVNSLIQICSDKQMDVYFPGEGHLIRQQIAGYLAQAIRSGDAGLLAVIAAAISDPATGMKNLLADSQGDLNKALAALQLPAEMEAYQEVAAALHTYGVDAPVIPDEQKNVRAIDWSLIDKLTPGSRAKISTNRGDIQIALFPDRAPATVSSFLRLVTSGFYADKAFHRVVPNFVVQTGCPRGDGYGSLDFTLRSELADTYYDEEGYVGMASAGPHTEGTQFFITHAPAPHLDGRYTIFGRVVSGMDVVHRIRVGDTIRQIELIY